MGASVARKLASVQLKTDDRDAQAGKNPKCVHPAWPFSYDASRLILNHVCRTCSSSTQGNTCIHQPSHHTPHVCDSWPPADFLVLARMRLACMDHASVLTPSICKFATSGHRRRPLDFFAVSSRTIHLHVLDSRLLFFVLKTPGCTSIHALAQ